MTLPNPQDNEGNERMGKTLGKRNSAEYNAKIRAGRPSAEDAEILHDRILDAGWDLLFEKGFEKFSIDRLARFARVGKPTIYSRFPNKKELLRNILIKRIKRQQESILSAADLSSQSDSIPILAAEAVMAFQSAEVRLIDRLIDWIDHEVDDEHPSLRGWTAETAIATLEEHISEAKVRGETEVADPRTAATLLVEAIVGHARLSTERNSSDRASHVAWAKKCWLVLESGLSR